MSEVEQYQDSGDHALIRWAEGARAAHSIAQSLSRTSFVSGTMKGKAEEITAAILTGQEIGLAPLSALRSIDIIQGTPALRAVALRGLVQSRGHDIWVEKSTVNEAVVCGQRAGSQHIQKSSWTLDRAQRLGLTGKDNWKKQPEAMLVARATAEICRLVASDVLLGMPYASEELADEAQSEAATRVARRTLKAKEQKPAPVEPDIAPEDTATPDAEVPMPELEMAWPEVAQPGGDE